MFTLHFDGMCELQWLAPPKPSTLQGGGGGGGGGG